MCRSRGTVICPSRASYRTKWTERPHTFPEASEKSAARHLVCRCPSTISQKIHSQALLSGLTRNRPAREPGDSCSSLLTTTVHHVCARCGAANLRAPARLECGRQQ